MTGADLAAAIEAEAAKIDVASLSRAKKIAIRAELERLAGQIPGLVPTITERRTPNSERRGTDSQGASMRRQAQRRGLRAGRTVGPPATPSGPTQLVIITQPAGFRDSTIGDTQPVIELQDGGGTPVAQADVAVTVQVASGSATLPGSPVTVLTNGSGRAEFSGLSLVGSGASTLSFTASGLTGVTSGSFTVNAATKVVVISQVGTAPIVSGQAFGQQPVVEIQDTNSLPVTKSGVTVTAAKATGTGTLGGTANTSTGANGRATWTNLALTGSDNHSLEFSSPGLTSATGAVFAVEATGGASPVVVEDFSSYTSIANFLTDPRGIYSGAWSQLDTYRMALDGAHGLNAGGYSLSQSLRYDFESYLTAGFPGNGQGCGILLTLPPHSDGHGGSDSIKDFWWEIWMKTSANWRLDNPNSPYPGGDWKNLYGQFSRDGWGRVEFHPNQNNYAVDLANADADAYHNGEPGFSLGNGWFFGNPQSDGLWDGSWHYIRGHYHISADPTTDQSSGMQFWVDGVSKFSRFNMNMHDQPPGQPKPGFGGMHLKLIFGAYSPLENQSLYWGRVAFWTSDPGW